VKEMVLTVLKNTTAFVIVVFLCIVGGYGVLFAYDRYIAPQSSFSIGSSASRTPWLYAFQMYPYTGFHIQSNYSEGRLSTGDHGFFIDFPIRNPPEKKPGEFRIVLTGGSAAQGVFVSSNEETMPHQLERALNKKASDKVRYKVINLAMSGSHTLQNYVALNLWAHQMKPDLILSFAGGRNDIIVPYLTHSDLPFMYQGVMGMVEAVRETNGPDWLRVLEDHFPKVFRGSSLAQAIRLRSLTGHTQAALGQYVASNHLPGDTYEKVIEPLYVHALKSIKRDFEGVPMAVVFQPVRFHPAHAAIWDKWMADYVKMRRDVPLQLRDYVNKSWSFFDMHAAFQEKGYDTQTYLMDDVHLMPEGGRVAGEMMADWLLKDVFPNL
jgi:lysophospholipase L1-like esterase